MARRLLALFGEQSFIFVQDLNTSFHNIQKTPLTRSGFETMFLHCIKSARFDARLHESPSYIYIWLLTSVTRAQPHAPSRLSGGERGLIPKQRLDTEPIIWGNCIEIRLVNPRSLEGKIVTRNLEVGGINRTPPLLSTQFIRLT